MRRVPLLLSLLAIGSALAFGLVVLEPDAGAAPAMKGQQVNMTITCVGKALDDVTVRPWTGQAGKLAGQQITWRLVGNGVDSATISAKSTSSWPFTSTPPLTVGQGQGTSSGPISGDATTGRYYYNITVDCGSGPEVIDPQMDIDP